MEGWKGSPPADSTPEQLPAGIRAPESSLEGVAGQVWTLRLLGNHEAMGIWASQNLYYPQRRGQVRGRT